MGLQLLHLHLHGLIRGKDLELGRDPDTGGQTLYVLELIKELANSSEVEHIELVTRLIKDRRVSTDYSLPRECIHPSAEIVRVPFGPKRYLRKELLWPFLDNLANQLINKLAQRQRLPDWIHAHYADAGYVGTLISQALDIPLVFTGHSLGREKKRRLIAGGMHQAQIENNYSISRRIDAEELAIDNSSLIITSTSQEADHQYARYKNFKINKAKVISPGVDLKRFNTSIKSDELNAIEQLFSPFLRDVSLPPLLSISRAVRRKNIPALIEVFGRSSILRKNHNLVLILGNRQELQLLDKQQREVFLQIFDLVDKYNLYGHVAFPKKHKRNQIAQIYKWAAAKKGLFVNPALTEPFGLTLLEAAASGLPMVATDDGGPSEILAKCGNGMLVDVTDLGALQKTLEQCGSNDYLWQRWSHNGIEGANECFSWKAHVKKYLSLVTSQLKSSKPISKLVHFSSIKAS